MKEPVVVSPVDLPKDLITKKDLDAELDTMGREAVGFFADLSVLSLRHLQQFGEILDTRALLNDKRVK